MTSTSSIALHRLKHYVLALLGAAMAAVFVPRTEAAPGPCLAEEEAERVAACVAAALERSWDPDELSGVLGVRKRGTASFVAYGRSGGAQEAPPTPETMFRIASMTKPVTAAVALSLVESSTLQLTDKVIDVVPELSDPRASAIEIRHLIEHTSGLPPSNGDLMAALSTVELTSEPGDRTAYSNLNYYALALVLERTTGRGLETLIHERIPALRGEFFVDEVPPSRPSARGMVPGLLWWWEAERVLPTTVFHLRPTKGAGGGISTPAAMLAFVDELFGGKVPGLQRIPGDVERGLDSALGWARNDRLLWHNGALQPYGWQSIMVWDPEQATAVVFLSNHDLAGGELDAAVMAALLRGSVDPPAADWRLRMFVFLFASHLLPLLTAGLAVSALRTRTWGGYLPFVALLAITASLHSLLATALCLVPGVVYAGWKAARRT